MVACCKIIKGNLSAVIFSWIKGVETSSICAALAASALVQIRFLYVLRLCFLGAEFPDTLKTACLLVCI
ncbi:hypothetical protein XELAEV_18036727mg [Xenopus laevis]|uniref:Uncharacterized protein n=1 Tax=Xenopus laevis TaxID=8355 RepID=A0A974CBU5_XENLA|nr:hypothetical protein XELAEV_18036727mg [Xenopus laevis]